MFTSLHFVSSLSQQAGSCPGGRFTFLVSPRKVSKRRRAECVVPALRYGHAALLGPRGVRANSLRSDMRAPFSARSCATRLRTRQWESGEPVPAPRPCVCAEERRLGRDKGCACLSAASLRRPRPSRAPQVAPASPGSQTPGSLFFAYFGVCVTLLSKVSKLRAHSAPGETKKTRNAGFGKSETPAGARPGKATLPGHGQKETSQTC